MTMRCAGIELGGTKSIAVLAEDDRIVARETCPTTDPETTLDRMHQCLAGWWREQPFQSIGIAAFGPIALARESSDFGRILATPKPGWSGARVAEMLTDGFDCAWAIDTDVNGAALAEYRWGAGKGLASLCYVTIGTGVGGGVLIAGRPVHGALHPELGHLRLRRAEDDAFAGACRFHRDCIEGLISGPALAERFGMAPAQVPDTHPAWDAVASDLAELCAAILLSVSAQRILFGGGVAVSRPSLLAKVRGKLVARLGGYLPHVDAESAETILMPAALGPDAGPLGAIALAQSAIRADA